MGNGFYAMYDLVDSYKKKIIEFNGNYYHMNPEIYSAETVNKRLNATAKEIWENDRRKLELVRDMGYEVLVVWEKEYKNEPDTIFKCINFLQSLSKFQ
jgi:G:T-mismatch repair DNA endonuclease (very short patch repair protein)